MESGLGVLVVVAIGLIWAGLSIRKSRQRKKRRASLHQDSTGTWFWTDFDGSSRSSSTHPDRKGGDWYSEPGGDGYDGGSDGGGDGGGD
ncbi:MAG: hypothetical protein ACRBB0_21965 [Pelagimonas sp.]|uniref:hypothetical protein n=1 Tax=Pelagimonas sp. TaxID=2073170 RepID=UPI003D6B46CB